MDMVQIKGFVIIEVLSLQLLGLFYWFILVFLLTKVVQILYAVTLKRLRWAGLNSVQWRSVVKIR